MKARMIVEGKADPFYPDKAKRGTMLPVGEIIDHPKAYMLVRCGTAVPADEECRVKAHRSEQQMQEAQLHQTAVAKGIHPDDLDAFFSGRMTGYHPDGSSIPGPNAVAEEEYDDDDRDETPGEEEE